MSQRWRIDIEYDGAPFAGWQIQPHAPTIQETIERAVEQLFGVRERVCASGRTDAGVHAEHQVATFVSDVERSEKAVRDGLNNFLPPSIAILRAQREGDDFDPRRQVKTKSYRYQWMDRHARSPLMRTRAWHVRSPLDAESMNAAVQHLVGTHDFTSFRAQGCQADHAVRTVPSAVVSREGQLVCLRVSGHGFLRHMIRIIAGTVVEVGRKKHPPDWIREVLERRDRRAAGRTAPALGLTLESVRYSED